MRRIELLLISLFIPLDAAFAILGGLMAYFIRSSSEVVPISFIVPFQTYVGYCLIGLPVLLVVYGLFGLYSLSVLRRRFLDETVRILAATTTVMMVLTAALFFNRIFDVSRLIILVAWLLIMIMVSLGRLGFRLIRHLLHLTGYINRRLVLIGSNELTETLIETVTTDRLLGYKLIGIITSSQRSQSDVPVLGTTEELPGLIERLSVDEIIVTDHRLPKKLMFMLINLAHRSGITFRYLPDLFEVTSHNAEVGSFGPVPLVTLKRTPLDGWGRILKRVFDLVVGSLLLLLFSPLMLLSALSIVIFSPGPILVERQPDGSRMTRIGRKGQPFTFYKFRTMIVGAHSLRYKKRFLKQVTNIRPNQPLYKFANDPRVTRIGRMLRKTSIDELPQLFSVITGQMSLVGPRPHLPEEVDRYQEEERRVLDVKPGITGLAQVSGRGDLPFHEEVKLDSYYIEHWSLLLDLAILLRTISVILFSRHSE